MNTLGLDSHITSEPFSKTQNKSICYCWINILKIPDSKGSNGANNSSYDIDLLEDILLVNGEQYSQNSFSLPLGFGLNLEVNERMNFKVSTVMHLTGTDYIDNILNGKTMHIQ